MTGMTSGRSNGNLRGISIMMVAAATCVTGCHSNSQVSEQGQQKEPSASVQSVTSSPAALSTPLPVRGVRAYTEEKPRQKMGKCTTNEQGVLDSGGYLYSRMPVNPNPFRKAVIGGDLQTVKKMVAAKPTIAAKPENRWALAFALEHGCLDLVDTLLEAGARPYNFKHNPLQMDPTLYIATEFGDAKLFDKLLGIVLAQEDDATKPHVWREALGRICSAPVSFWDVYTKHGAPLYEPGISSAGLKHVDYLPQHWTKLLDCEAPDMLIRASKDKPGLPKEALVLTVSDLCWQKGKPERDARHMSAIRVDTIWTLRSLGYSLTDVVEFTDRQGKKKKGSAKSITDGLECAPEVSAALGRQ